MDSPQTPSARKPAERDRPMAEEFKTLFAMLIITLPMKTHRVRLGWWPNTFTSTEAIENLQELKVERASPGPVGSGSSTITTTTVSMSAAAAERLCWQFHEARFIAPVDASWNFGVRDSVWQLTRKGLRVLSRVCNRTGMDTPHIETLSREMNPLMALIIMERDFKTDKIHVDRPIIDCIFSRLLGPQPNTTTKEVPSRPGSSSDTYTLTPIKVQKMTTERSSHPVHAFSGAACFDWLMSNVMICGGTEAMLLANLFMAHGLISAVINPDLDEDEGHGYGFSRRSDVFFYITERGIQLAGWQSVTGEVQFDLRNFENLTLTSTDTKTEACSAILAESFLRFLFREFLENRRCEENLTFYLRAKELLDNKIPGDDGSSSIRAAAAKKNALCNLYNTFIAEGAPSEINLASSLRKTLETAVLNVVSHDDIDTEEVAEVTRLLQEAMNHIFNVMATDCVPIFLKERVYAEAFAKFRYERDYINGSNLGKAASTPRSGASSAKIPGSPATRAMTPTSVARVRA